MDRDSRFSSTSKIPRILLSGSDVLVFSNPSDLSFNNVKKMLIGLSWYIIIQAYTNVNKCQIMSYSCVCVYGHAASACFSLVHAWPQSQCELTGRAIMAPQAAQAAATGHPKGALAGPLKAIEDGQVHVSQITMHSDAWCSHISGYIYICVCVRYICI